MTDYVVLQYDFPEKLAGDVKKRLADGWRLYGDLIVSAVNVPRVLYIQVMVK